MARRPRRCVVIATLRASSGVSLRNLIRWNSGEVPGEEFWLLEGRGVLLVGLAPIIALENIYNLGININSKYGGNQVAMQLPI